MTTTLLRRNPQKRNILIRKIARAPWWLLILALLVIAFFLSVYDQDRYNVIIPAVREGIWTTIWVSVVAYLLALVLGLIVALLRRTGNIAPVQTRNQPKWKIVRGIIGRGLNVAVYQTVTLYVEVVRGIPTLILVYYMTLALVPEIFDQLHNLGIGLIHLKLTFFLTDETSFRMTFGGLGTWLVNLDPKKFPYAYRVIVALAISYSAFLSEIFRAGIESVSVGQHEAARSLGMTRWQTMRLIVLPQAFRVILPPLGNDFIAMLKESSLVSAVGVLDITRKGQTIATSKFWFFEVYNVVALTYLVLTITLSILVKGMEMYLGRGQRRES
jgi:polar amino acid transport system permease protein